jgi:hypothetical protein
MRSPFLTRSVVALSVLRPDAVETGSGRAPAAHSAAKSKFTPVQALNRDGVAALENDISKARSGSL